MGFYIGKARFSDKKEQRKWLILSLTLPVLFHGLYDFILLGMKNWGYIMLPFMIFLMVVWPAKSKKGSFSENGAKFNVENVLSVDRAFFCLFIHFSPVMNV